MQDKKDYKSAIKIDGITIYSEQKFNKLQKYMWKKLLGFTIENIGKEDK